MWDSDGDGFLNRDDDDTPDDFAFEPQVDVAVDTVVVSNEAVISGLKEGGTTEVSVSNGQLIVNDQDVIDGYAERDSIVQAQIQNGDKIKVRVTSSSKYISAVIVTIRIGSIVRQFSVTTDNYIPKQF